jgi:hypothetical protein
VTYVGNEAYMGEMKMVYRISDRRTERKTPPWSSRNKGVYRASQNLCHKLFLGIPHPHLCKKFLSTWVQKWTGSEISTNHPRGKTSDHILKKCLGWYRWGSADWSSPFTRAVDGAYVPGIFGTTDARHLAWCAWW